MAEFEMPRGMCPLIANYTGGDMGGVEETEVEGGAPRTSLAYDRGVQPFTVTLALNVQKYRIWTLFYHRLIKRGTIPFTMTLDSGFGPQPHTVFIAKGSYQESGRTTRHRFVTFIVRAEPKAYDVPVDDAQREVDLWNRYENRLFPFFGRLAIFANEDVLKLR